MPENQKKRLGRPPRPDAGNYEFVGFRLRTDLKAYATVKAANERRSLSGALHHLIEQGVALEVEREVRRRRIAERRERRG